ncbi:hypothetical protein H1P_2990007 [Hyella patelloides LEGE 07179]|uniref:Uncharacterized protein n=1 Tax=Hyella patelloides LEGE 07179 TaxID=945734 RepID=A0A563VU37_9CYAN|nr:hypothetical protein H1P_2990007 [Hyella patelloides LEGE 07179]
MISSYDSLINAKGTRNKERGKPSYKRILRAQVLNPLSLSNLIIFLDYSIFLTR